MRTTHIHAKLFTFFALSLLIAIFFSFTVLNADARTIVVGGSVTSSSHAKLVDTFVITGIDPAKLSNDSKITYNVPVYVSDSVSGFSQAISGFSATAGPAPATTTGPLTDSFGNQYYHYEWSLNGYQQSSFTFTVTTEFDCTATGNPVPESFTDPYPVSAAGMSQYLQPTAMVQSDNAQIISAAQSAVSGATTEAGAVEMIMGYVRDHVDDKVSNPSKDAVSTLTAGSGNCVNFAHLALAMLRAEGIPARLASGVISDDPYQVTFVAPEGQGVFETSWGKETHTWVEVYYPQKGVWVAYDPQRDFGFVDHRHAKRGIAIDNDVTGKTTGGLGTLLETYTGNKDIGMQHTTDISFTQVQDSGSYTFRFLKEPPQSTYVLARDMVNAPTPTPTPTLTPTQVPSITPTPTPAPVQNSSSSITPTPINNSTITPTPTSPASSEGPYEFFVNGTIIDAGTGIILDNATIILDGQPVTIDSNGAFSVLVSEGAHSVSVSAPGYETISANVTVSTEDVNETFKLIHVRASGDSLPTGTPGFGIWLVLVGLLIIGLYRHGRA